MDGFETGDLSLWTTYQSATIQTATPASFSGTYMLQCSVSQSVTKDLGSNKSELYLAFKFYPTSDSYSEQIMYFKDSTASLGLTINRNTSTYLASARLSWGGTLLATGITLMPINKTYLIEVYYKPLNSGGVITLKIDGIQQFSFSGDTTSINEEIRYVCLGGVSGVSNSAAYYDDFIIDDANWIGNTRVGIIVPDGTGTTNNWTASAGNAWDCLNEKPPSDTDYVYSNTTNQIATYAMTTIASMNSVKAIQLQGSAAYEGSPTPTKIQLGVRASGTDYFATDFSPGVGFGMLTKILELNPADSAAWEQADIDALEVGVKATA
jgi:hypothetical protein